MQTLNISLYFIIIFLLAIDPPNINISISPMSWFASQPIQQAGQFSHYDSPLQFYYFTANSIRYWMR